MYVPAAMKEASPVPPEQSGDTLDVPRCHQVALCPHDRGRVGWCLCAGKRLIDFGTVKYGDVFRKKTCPDPIMCKHFTHLADPLSAIPLPLTDLFSVVSDSNHHTAELFIFIHSGIQFKASCVRLNFLKKEFFLSHLPCTIETVTV